VEIVINIKNERTIALCFGSFIFIENPLSDYQKASIKRRLFNSI